MGAAFEQVLSALDRCVLIATLQMEDIGVMNVSPADQALGNTERAFAPHGKATTSRLLVIARSSKQHAQRSVPGKRLLSAIASRFMQPRKETKR